MESDKKSDLWMSLAELASTEEDPERLMALATEINRLLEENEHLAKVDLAKVNPEIARLLNLKQALLRDGSTKPDAK